MTVELREDMSITVDGALEVGNEEKMKKRNDDSVDNM